MIILGVDPTLYFHMYIHIQIYILDNYNVTSLLFPLKQLNLFWPPPIYTNMFSRKFSVDLEWFLSLSHRFLSAILLRIFVRYYHQRAEQMELSQDVLEACALGDTFSPRGWVAGRLDSTWPPEVLWQEGEEGKEKIKLLDNEYNKVRAHVFNSDTKTHNGLPIPLDTSYAWKSLASCSMGTQDFPLKTWTFFGSKKQEHGTVKEGWGSWLVDTRCLTGPGERQLIFSPWTMLITCTSWYI